MKKFSSCDTLEVISSGNTVSKESPFEVPDKDGMLYVRVRAIASKVNNNYDAFEREELRKAYKSFIGKPVFIEHQNNNPEHARGLIIDAAFHDDQPHAWIELLLEVDGKAYPLLAEGLKKGRINKVSMGTNVEYSICSVCGNEARNASEYCYHMKHKGRIFKNARGEDVLAYEINRGLDFFEISFVVAPAEEWADVLAVYGEQDDNKLKKIASRIRKKNESVEEWNRRANGLKKVAQVIRGGNDMEVYHTDETIPIKKAKFGNHKEYISLDELMEEMKKESAEESKGHVFFSEGRKFIEAGLKMLEYFDDFGDLLNENYSKHLPYLPSFDEFLHDFMSLLEDLEESASEIKSTSTRMGKTATQGVFVNGERPPTKMQLKKAIKENPESVVLEATSAFGDEYSGPITEAPDGSYYIVGPHPYNRKWFAQIKKSGDIIRISSLDKRMMKEAEEPSAPTEPDVIITVSGGVAQIVKCPPDIRVEIRDYDVEGDEENLDRDDEGYPYIKITSSMMMKEAEEFSAPAKPDTIVSPEGDEIRRDTLEPVEKKEEKTLDAFLERLQSLIDEFKAEKPEEEEPPAEDEIDEINEEIKEEPPVNEVNEEESLPPKEMSEEKITKEAVEEDSSEENISYTQILLAKRLVQELKKRGAIAEEEEIDKEAEYSKLSVEELEEKVAFISSIPMEEEGKSNRKVARKSPPVLRRSLAMDRIPIDVDKDFASGINPSQMFI